MRFNPTPFLIIVLSTAACHDRELASPYTGRLSRLEAEVAAFHLRNWADYNRGIPGVDGNIPPYMPLEGTWSERCRNTGTVRLTHRHAYSWNDSTRIITIDNNGKIDQDECRYGNVRGVTITISAKGTLRYSSRSHDDGPLDATLGRAFMSDAFTDQVEGSFTWTIGSHRRGKCFIDFRYVWDSVTKTQKRTGNVCGHLFNDTRDLTMSAAGTYPYDP